MIKEQLRFIQPYKPGKQIDEVKAELGLESVEKLASNENPFGCSENVVEKLREAVTDVSIYPDGYATTLRKRVSVHLNVDETQLIFGNGTDEVLHIISRAYIVPGSNAVMATPTFPQYKRNVLIDGGDAIEVPLIDGRHDLDTMLNKINENTKIVWLCNPNNPTGEYIRNDELIEFLDRVPTDVLVVLDEAYIEYVSAEDYPNALELIGDYSNLILTRTFSKIYGLAGLRIGFGVANSDLIRSLEPAREPFNASRLAQTAACAALEDQLFIQDCHEKNSHGLKQYYDFCDEYGLDYYKSQGNFILIDVKESGDHLFQYLLSHGYIVRSGEALGYPNGIRITIGNDKQNHAIIKLLKEYFS